MNIYKSTYFVAKKRKKKQTKFSKSDKILKLPQLFTGQRIFITLYSLTEFG